MKIKIDNINITITGSAIIALTTIAFLASKI